jgi:hypothetical protein
MLKVRSRGGGAGTGRAWVLRAGEGAVEVGVADLVDAEGTGVAESADVPVGVGVAESAGVPVGVGVAEGDGVPDGAGVAEGAGTWPLSGAEVPAAVPTGMGRSELTPAPLTSRPAWSMANHAVTDTPATAASQIVAMPTAKRSFSTM